MRSATICFAALTLALLFRLAAADTAWQGRKLSDYLDFLNAQGAKIIYTSDLVVGDMRLARDELRKSGALKINATTGGSFDQAALDKYLQPIIKRLNDEIAN